MGPESLETADDVGPVRVFMSYRRADDRHFVGRLHDRLCDAFGEERVFRDIDSIPAGTNFRQVILRTLDEVDAVVAVIGPNWARPSGGDAAASTDYMFLELIEALKQGKPLVPVLIEDTLIPSLDGLPPDLRALREINAISVHADPAFRRDSERLIDAINAVVAEDRARIKRERQAIEEQVRRAEAERAQRERRADELRAEERAARARLAELEEVATRRQIELERDRLAAIEEQLRKAELIAEAPPAVTAPPEIPAAVPRAAAPFEPPRATAPEISRAPSTAAAVQADIPVFELLIIAALVLGIVGLFLNRSMSFNDSFDQFNEMGSTTSVDILVMMLTLAIAVPLFLGRHPVEQRFVLAGIAVSTFLFQFVQDSASLVYGTEGYSEGSWYLLKIVEVACLVGAYQVLRRRSSGSISSPPRFRIPLVVIAIGCAALLVPATHDEWADAQELIDNSVVPDRAPLFGWLVLSLLPIAVVLALAARGTYTAQVTLATIATLGMLNYFAHASFLLNTFFQDGSRWTLVAIAYLLLAALAWSVVVVRARSASTKPATRHG
jgi:hypothetical protein